MSLKIGQQKLLKLRGRKKDKKIENIKEQWDRYKRPNVCVKGPKEERERGNIFKVVRAEDFYSTCIKPKIQNLREHQAG